MLDYMPVAESSPFGSPKEAFSRSRSLAVRPKQPLFDVVNNFRSTKPIENIREEMKTVMDVSRSEDEVGEAIVKPFDPSQVVNALVQECLFRNEGNDAVGHFVFAAR